MTIKRIYIRGNVGDPNNVDIYDADTDKKIQVVHLSMDVSTTGVHAAITLAPKIQGVVLPVEVVPPPPHPAAGKVLKEVELEQYRQHNTTVHRATMTEWTVQPDGTVKPNALTRYQQQHTVDDVVLANYPGNASDVLEDSARQVLTGMTHHMISPQLAAVMKTGKPMATGGGTGTVVKAFDAKGNVIKPVTPKSDRDKKLNSNSKAICEECGGSGEYISQITYKKSDCSQGCKRPTK
jgi:hypothetical protein